MCFNCSIESQQFVYKAGVPSLFFCESEVCIQSRCALTVLLGVRSFNIKQVYFNCYIGSQNFVYKAGVL